MARINLSGILGDMGGTVILGKQGRLVVPAELRAGLGLTEGDVLTIQADGTRLIIERRDDAIRRLRGMVTARSGGRSLVEELLSERVAEVRRG